MGVASRHILYSEHYQTEAKNYRDYLELLGYAQHTCQSRYLYLKEFFSYQQSIGIYQIQRITSVEINRYYQYLQSRESQKTKTPLQVKTVCDIMRSVQMYFGYVLHLDKIKIHPASHLRLKYPNTQYERIIFSKEQIAELYKVIETDQELGLLNIAYGCGLRVSEISQLNCEDIRLSEKILIVEKGKNNKRRLVPISDKLKQSLGEFIALSVCPKQAVFINARGSRMREWTLNQRFKKLIKRTEFGQKWSRKTLRRIGIHSLRHSIATHLLANGMKLEHIQLFLGHSHMESTEIYTHINQNQLQALTV